MSRPTILPTIHLNGSSPDTLREDWIAVMDAVRALEEALRQASPHGRDYYPQGDDAYAQAAKQHLEEGHEPLARVRKYADGMLRHVANHGR